MNIRRLLAAGVIASIVMGMIEMIYEAVAGAGFWSPVVFISATILRGLQSVPVPVPFDFWGVLVGLMGHMMNSIIFGILFGWIVFRTSLSRVGLVSAGALYGLAIFVVMWYAVVPRIDPVMLTVSGTVFAISHLMWGAALGLFAPASEPALNPQTA